MIQRRKLSHKFKAKPVDDDGQHFASKLEWSYYVQLKLRKRLGEVLFFLRQVPIQLPGNVRYVIDFVEFLSNGEVVFTEVKGMMTDMARLKIAQVEELYPIKINVVRKGDF
jgi:hypothetical protein